ncbi:MAG: hypothetical protein ABS58_09485 [Mesorhizobium sp. SCN 65-20]|nr:MAG: hypothetical protein ABS58_09485 [Mesorhizobium sp. SCN 65-20]
MIGSVLLGSAFVGGTILITLMSYFFMRWITGGGSDASERELASSITVRISALHGLILALVFAQEMIEYQQLKYESATEADAIADVYYDAERYGAAAQAAIQKSMSAYLKVVVEKEWDQLGSTGELAQEGWVEWDNAYRAALDLTPTTERQKSLRDHMLSQIQAIADTRVKRSNHSAGTINTMFWFAALSGLILMALSYYPFRAERRSVLLIALFGAYTGIILFLIYAFSNPYSRPAILSPAAYEHLQRQISQPGN